MHLIFISSSPSSSRLASVFQWHAHNTAVVFHTLHKGQRDTRLCSLISYRSLCCTLTFALSRKSSIILSPSLFSPVPFHHCRFRFLQPRQVNSHLFPQLHPYSRHGALSHPSRKSNSYRVAMYCVTVLWRRLIYYSIVKNPASSLSVIEKVYLHFLSDVLHGSRPVSCLDTWVLNRVDRPGLLSKEQYSPYHGLKKEAGHPWHRSLPAEDA